jgi:predicted nucleic acid-binding protein
MNAVDTNVLVYAHDPREPKKQVVAASLIASLTDAVLLWQVACEYVSVSKKLEPLGYNRAQAWQDIRDLRLVWAAALPNWDITDRAEELMNRYPLAYWDAMIVAACLEAGVRRLYTEDFSGIRIDSLEIVNPFSGKPEASNA